MQGGAAVAGQLVMGRVPLAARASAKGSARAGSRRACVVRAAKGKREEEELPSNVSYGSDWYEATRRLSKRRSTREALSACAAALSACAAGSRTLTRAVPMSRQPSTARQTSGCATGLREARGACANAARFDACPAGQQRQGAQGPVLRQLGRRRVQGCAAGCVAPASKASRIMCGRDAARPPTGSGFNILNVVLVAFFLTPVLGLAFAYWSYGVLWG
jgi:hypothetical protein